MGNIGDDGWLRLAAEALECGLDDLGGRAASASFAALGGTSLRGIEFAALMARDYGRRINVGALLGAEPLADVVAGAPPAEEMPHTRASSDGEAPPVGLPADGRAPYTEPPADGRALYTEPPAAGARRASRIQQAMLFSEDLYGGSAFHLLFSAEISGPLDLARLRSALARLTARHASLRTMFARGEDGMPTRHVLDRWDPVIVEQPMPRSAGDPVSAVHALLGPASATLLRPYERPPVAFVVSRTGEGRAVLSILVHHAIVDGWSIGLLWRELASGYASGEAVHPEAGIDEAPSMEPMIALEASPAVREAARLRAEALSGLPSTVSLPTDLARPQRMDRSATRLVFELGDEARAGCAALAETAGLTRTMVLLAAWALVVARRTAVPEFVMGMVSAGRTTAESLAVAGPYMKLLPVACRIPREGSVIDYLRATAVAAREALDAGDVPAEDIVTALGLGGDDSRNPLVQVAFAAHDELVPETLRAGDLAFAVREGHCGGTVYDAVLYVQRWGDSPRLALEYPTSVLRADEAAELATALERTLAELAAAPYGPLADVRTMTGEQRRWLATRGQGPDAEVGGLWQLFEAAARRDPGRVAVRDADPLRVLTYGQLLRAAEVQSSVLAAAGVTAGDSVALAVSRSAREILAILAVLRLGAAYVAVERDVPGPAVRTMLDSVGVRLMLGDDDRLRPLGEFGHGRPALRILDPWDAAASHRQAPPAPDADSGRVAYVAFTSGSTGTPKGATVSHRGVARLALDPRYLLPGACDRFVRLAPLAFDASTLEIFAPLLNGGTVEVFSEEYVTPDGLAEFLSRRQITGLWLTAGLFRLTADYRPGAFQTVKQVLTGGDVVPPTQVARVLSECPGLRVTNGYGPTENTTFTTVHHVDSVAGIDDPLPIGRPIQGTGVLVLDAGGRLVPPGGVGELYTYGDGLALGYAGLPAETAAAFGPFSADVDRLLYRTGDLVRWDGGGRLRFLGRRDRQVKIRGFRVELDAVTRVLREHPDVRDAAVVPTASADRRLLAGIVAKQALGLLESVRAFAAERLPGYAMPSLWAVVPELPITRNGKLDAARLHELALAGESEPAEEPREDGGDLASAIARVWSEVLSTDSFGLDQRFFEVGGDSLQLLRVAAGLRRDLPGHDVSIQDLYACQTIRTLAGRLSARTRP
ncbi:amino acid adenylation domain-containing protein [Nonomuraea cavernae]|uniref:non-ribosomal peptide synthetase n=1 Tax=Nonomuraea cavernae TaxID=2045107 RepID=UPI0033CEA850